MNIIPVQPVEAAQDHVATNSVVDTAASPNTQTRTRWGFARRIGRVAASVSAMAALAAGVTALPGGAAHASVSSSTGAFMTTSGYCNYGSSGGVGLVGGSG